MASPSSVRVDDKNAKIFTYDFSYDSTDRGSSIASQEKIFDDLGIDVLKAAFEGFNACVFAYGQTGSGKSYTMMGHAEEKGLIPRICEGLCSKISERSTSSTVSFRTEVSFMEIYNERVHDLLKKRTVTMETGGLRVREHPRDGPYVENLSKHLVHSYSNMEQLIAAGNTNRITASTGMNDSSSRSHVIFTISFTRAWFDSELPHEILSKIHLVDLAGSERTDTTRISGVRLKEGANINKSLVTLGTVISALAELSAGQPTTKKMTFIPYRDSVLTWLLKDSLGGNSKTTMIATISPANVNYVETLSTLRYANRARNIMNTPTVNEDSSVKLIRDIQSEITRLKRRLETKQLSHREPSSSLKVEVELHQNEEKVCTLTKEWTCKWEETRGILQEEGVALKKQGSAVVLDCQFPHLIGIDEDLLRTGIVLYYLKVNAVPGKVPVRHISSELDGSTQQNGVNTRSDLEQEIVLCHKSRPELSSEHPWREAENAAEVSSYTRDKVWSGDASLQQTSVLGPGDECVMKPEGNANEIQDFPAALVSLQNLSLQRLRTSIQSVLSSTVLVSQKIVALFWLNVATFSQPEPCPALLVLLEAGLYTLTVESGQLVLYHQLPFLHLKEFQISFSGHGLRLMGTTQESILGLYTHSEKLTQEVCCAILGIMLPGDSRVSQHPLFNGDWRRVGNKLSLDSQTCVPDLQLDTGLRVCCQFQKSLADLVYLLYCNMEEGTSVTLGELQLLMYTSVKVCLSSSSCTETVTQLLLTDTHIGLVQEDVVFYPTPRSGTIQPCHYQFRNLTLRQRADVRCMVVHDEDKCRSVTMDLIFASMKARSHPESVKVATPPALASNSSPRAEVWKLTFSCSTEAACLISYLSDV
ncbi:LOW QUALITY PROTEIN: kinesin-like protein KIF16B [Phycodurus eques]|uniref:LOW QUALITY PROTEIN: kinesin-like protein KIF16B n=1 Tax=Phycodurus eques TaxID=693459 RepID=UPI002ACEED5D|nr:LOW QUALITY PROTEIN: kinesin-like protein KIF16B [Phycodurus eques]